MPEDVSRLENTMTKYELKLEQFIGVSRLALEEQKDVNRANRRDISLLWWIAFCTVISHLVHVLLVH